MVVVWGVVVCLGASPAAFKRAFTWKAALPDAISCIRVHHLVRVYTLLLSHSKSTRRRRRRLLYHRQSLQVVVMSATTRQVPKKRCHAPTRCHCHQGIHHSHPPEGKSKAKVRQKKSKNMISESGNRTRLFSVKARYPSRWTNSDDLIDEKRTVQWIYVFTSSKAACSRRGLS
jgi:hypothetical protein